MPVGNEKRRKSKQGSVTTKDQSELERLQSDLAGLERLHALQTTLIREIRRQVEEIQAAPMK